jgi:hypothetical protein
MLQAPRLQIELQTSRMKKLRMMLMASPNMTTQDQTRQSRVHQSHPLHQPTLKTVGIVMGLLQEVMNPEYTSLELSMASLNSTESHLEIVGWHLWTFPAFQGSLFGSTDLKDSDAPTIEAEYLVDFDEAKTPHVQFYGEDDDLNSEGFIDWADWEAWTPHTLKLAFFRGTGQSCRVHDWKDLEKDYITWKEADSAKRYATKYLEKAILKGCYKSDDVDYLYCAMEFDSMEGYGKVKVDLGGARDLAHWYH